MSSLLKVCVLVLIVILVRFGVARLSRWSTEESIKFYADGRPPSFRRLYAAFNPTKKSALLHGFALSNRQVEFAEKHLPGKELMVAIDHAHPRRRKVYITSPCGSRIDAMECDDQTHRTYTYRLGRIQLNDDHPFALWGKETWGHERVNSDIGLDALYIDAKKRTLRKVVLPMRQWLGRDLNISEQEQIDRIQGRTLSYIGLHRNGDITLYHTQQVKK